MNRRETGSNRNLGQPKYSALQLLFIDAQEPTECASCSCQRAHLCEYGIWHQPRWRRKGGGAGYELERRRNCCAARRIRPHVTPGSSSMIDSELLHSASNGVPFNREQPASTRQCAPGSSNDECGSGAEVLFIVCAKGDGWCCLHSTEQLLMRRPWLSSII